MQKSELRKQIRLLKKAYSPAELAAMSDRLCRQIMASERWQHARVVLLYHALPDEVDTRLLLEDALQKQKTVLLPVVEGDDLVLCRYEGLTREGAFGIQEPVGEVFTALESIELAIVPGMAFDARNNRLGRGKGYYDRLLPQLDAYRLGLCFPFQMCEEIAMESHDIAMDEVVSRI